MDAVADRVAVKDWLGYELARNKAHGALYTDLLKRALAQLAPGTKVDVLIGHHVTFELDGALDTENEIPSADCLIFDHQIMQAVFGADAMFIMVELAKVPCDERDALLTRHLAQLDYVQGAARC